MAAALVVRVHSDAGNVLKRSPAPLAPAAAVVPSDTPRGRRLSSLSPWGRVIFGPGGSERASVCCPHHARRELHDAAYTAPEPPKNYTALIFCPENAERAPFIHDFESLLGRTQHERAFCAGSTNGFRQDGFLQFAKCSRSMTKR